MAEFMGDDEFGLPVLAGGQQGVVDDDPPGRAKAGDVGVERGRAAGGVGDQDLPDADTVTGGEREEGVAQRAGRHRGEAVEHRLQQHRGDERQHDRRAGGDDGRPTPRKRVDDAERPHDERQGDRQPAQPVGPPAAPALGDEPEPGPHGPHPGGEGQFDQLAEDDQQHSPADDPGPPGVPEHAGQPGTARREAEDEQQRESRRTAAEQPGQLGAAQRPTAGGLLGGELAGEVARGVHRCLRHDSSRCT
jgi:hypothetical protein